MFKNGTLPPFAAVLLIVGLVIMIGSISIGTRSMTGFISQSQKREGRNYAIAGGIIFLIGMIWWGIASYKK